MAVWLISFTQKEPTKAEIFFEPFRLRSFFGHMMNDTHSLHRLEWCVLVRGKICQSYLLWSFWPLICDHDSLWESPGKQSLEDTSVVPLPSSYTSQHQQVHQQAWQTIAMVMARSGQEDCLGSGWLRPNELLCGSVLSGCEAAPALHSGTCLFTISVLFLGPACTEFTWPSLACALMMSRPAETLTMAPPTVCPRHHCSTFAVSVQHGGPLNDRPTYINSAETVGVHLPCQTPWNP